MKICNKCDQDKSEEEFAWKNKKKGIKSPICRTCQKQASDLWYQNNKEKHKSNTRKNTSNYRDERRKLILEYLQKHPCIDCGESDIVVLDFDHIDPKNKKYNIAASYYVISLDELQKEIVKCEIRCSNCHRRKTAKDKGYYRILYPSNQISLLNC